MKISRYIYSFIGLIVATAIDINAQQLVILHTNDTHSQVDPDDTDKGGALRRKVLIDSVRAVEPNVLLVDAGDAVQGTLYFTLFNGEIEQKLLNEMGYDIQIVGNHEFDNGVDALADNYRNAQPLILSTNYDFSNTKLKNYIRPYAIKQYEGRRIGIIAINLNPNGMIAKNNFVGIRHLDEVEAANSTAWYLKNIEHVDIVVAITHIGYDINGVVSDVDVIKNSRNIDIVIGAHSHTIINPDDAKSPSHLLPNADGKLVLIAQTGKSGRFLGEIKINLSNLSSSSRLIAVDNRLDNRIDARLDEIIKPYRAGVDSLMSVRVGYSAMNLEAGSQAILNLISDFILAEGERTVGGHVDLSIMNKGGIRRGVPKGHITKGMIMSMLPFENKVYVIDIKGEDLVKAFDVMASRNGDGVSKNVDITFDPTTHHCTNILISGEPLNLQKIYRVATIDYLANGGDYMKPLTQGRVVATSSERLDQDLIEQFERGDFKGKKIRPSDKIRMHH